MKVLNASSILSVQSKFKTQNYEPREKKRRFDNMNKVVDDATLDSFRKFLSKCRHYGIIMLLQSIMHTMKTR